MKVKMTPTHYILDPTCHNITTTMVDFLTVATKSMPKDKPCAFDLLNVETCSNQFFIMLKNFANTRKISIINANDKVLVALYLMKYDLFVNVYSNEVDLEESRHEVINRRFSLICA